MELLAGAVVLSQDPLAQLVTEQHRLEPAAHMARAIFYQPTRRTPGTTRGTVAIDVLWWYRWSMKKLAWHVLLTIFWKPTPAIPYLSFSIPAWDSMILFMYGLPWHSWFSYWYSGGVSSPDDGHRLCFLYRRKTWWKYPNHIFPYKW